MMEQYDKQEAVRFMLKNMDDSAFKPLSGRAEALFAQAVEADIAYMRSAGVIDEEGLSGQAYYDDDDAFEFLLDALKWKGMRNKDEEMLAAFIDEYMELQQRYMEEKGLVEWD